ncbi:MAG: DUF4416 family protein [Planctomycetes bacterium]|nr:DUF4416 family protein [Planctomycetota bacterium]
MAQVRPVQPVKLIVGMLSQAELLFDAAREKMPSVWGTIDIVGEVMPFVFTDYYFKQMGAPLLRQFVSFEKLIDPVELAQIKHQSNSWEDELGQIEPGRALSVARPINLDPGYIEQSKLVLATTKNYSHRIYIGDSMYAETTLQYNQGRWETWPFTYPDYGSGAYDDFLTKVRDRLLEQLSSKKPNT